MNKRQVKLPSEMAHTRLLSDSQRLCVRVHTLNVRICGYICAFHLQHGKKWAIWPISLWPVYEEHVFSTPRGFWNNGIIFAKCGSEQDFLLGKTVTDLRGQKEGSKKKSQGGKDEIIEKKRAGGEGSIKRGEKEEKMGGTLTKESNTLPHMWILTNSYPPSFWAAWNMVQRLTVGDRRQTRLSGMLGKNLSWNT